MSNKSKKGANKDVDYQTPPAPLRRPSKSTGSLAQNANGPAAAVPTAPALPPSPSQTAALRPELDDIERGLRAPLPTARADTADNSNPGLQADLDLQLQTAKKLRNLLASHRDVVIHEVLERNWVPRLLEWLKPCDLPAVQVEALWALTNITAGTTEHTQTLLRHNPVPPLVALLDSRNLEILEQALWVLGNIAGESASARDTVLNNGALRPLVDCIHRHCDNLQILRIGSWAINNLCDTQPRPTLDTLVLMPTLTFLLYAEDSEVLSHTCWALSHLCDGPSTHIRAVVEARICARLVELLKHRSWRVTKPALRTIGNIVCAEDEIDYTQNIIRVGAVPHLRELIAHQNREIQKEACWTLSNIAAGTCEQIQTVLDSGAIPLLVNLAMQSITDAEVRSEACWVVLNATSCGSDSQIEYLVQHDCIRVLTDLLGESNMVMMALEGLERILQVGDEHARRLRRGNPYANVLSAAKIEELESHRSTNIAKRASHIWKTHFVTCAICSRTYSKQSPDVGFCDECKCYVCSTCNCTVFHLSYQEELWKEMSAKETSAKAAQLASKRNRKARKKQREKEKRGGGEKDGPGGEKESNGHGLLNGKGGEEFEKDTASSDGAGGKDGTTDSDGGDSEAASAIASEELKSGNGSPLSPPPIMSRKMASAVAMVVNGHGDIPVPSSPEMKQSISVNGGGKRTRQRGAHVQPPSMANGHTQSPTRTGKKIGQGGKVGTQGRPPVADKQPVQAQQSQTMGKSDQTMLVQSLDAFSTALGGEARQKSITSSPDKTSGHKSGWRSPRDGSSEYNEPSAGKVEVLKLSQPAKAAAGVDLVDYLQSTGSIIALSRFLDNQEGDGP